MTNRGFKAWHKKFKNFHVDDNLVINQEGELHSRGDNGEENGGWDYSVEDEYIAVWSTGLTDKNGIEVHAGHIDKSGFSVEWFRGGFICNGQPIGLDCSYPDETWIEVIGNIYQNPELLHPLANHAD